MSVITQARICDNVDVYGWIPAQGNSCSIQLYFHEPKPHFIPCDLPADYCRMVEINGLVFKQYACEKHALEDGEV